MSQMSQSINLYNQLNNKFSKSIRFGLKRVRLALKLLGNPEKKLNNVISVLGESGKFTTLYSLKSFIEANNESVSAYISPSLKDIRERFYIKNRHLTFREIKKTIMQIEKLNIPLTIFEVLTLVFILNASRSRVNYTLMECGALWRFDCCNIIDFPMMQVCTNINRQHLNFLKTGSLEEIIREDVGFLSNFTNIYIAKQTPYVLKKIKNHLKDNRSRVIYPNVWKLIKKGKNYYYQDKKFRIKLNTRNVYSNGMYENVCHAIKIALDLNIDKKVIQKTLPSLAFEGRYQYLKKGKIIKRLYKNENIMIDGAHAVADAENLAKYLKTVKSPKYGIWAMTKNKEPDEFIKKLKGIFKKIIVITIENEPSSLSNKELLEIAKNNNLECERAKNFNEALKKICSRQKKLIVCFGSLYNAGSILKKN